MGSHCGVPAPCCRTQEETGEEVAEPVVEKMLKDEIIRLTNIKASAKIRSVWRQSRERTNTQPTTPHTRLLRPPSGGWSVCHVLGVS